MSKGGNTTTQTTNSAPWEGAQPYLKDVLSGAQTAYQSGKGFDSPNFNTVVPFSAQTTQAQNMTSNIANQGNPLAGQSMSALSGILQGNGNPYWQQAVDTQAGKLTSDINRGASAAGRYGSAYNSGTIADQVGQFRNQALSDNWNSNVANQLNAVNAAPGAYQQQYAPAQALAGVGAQQDDLATRTMQDQINRFQTTQQQPWNSLSAYNALIGGAGQLGSSSTTNATQPSNPWQAVGGVTSLLGLLGI